MITITLINAVIWLTRRRLCMKISHLCNSGSHQATTDYRYICDRRAMRRRASHTAGDLSPKGLHCKRLHAHVSIRWCTVTCCYMINISRIARLFVKTGLVMRKTLTSSWSDRFYPFFFEVAEIFSFFHHYKEKRKKAVWLRDTNK